MSELKIASLATDAGHRLELAGELDFHTAPRLRDALKRISLKPGQQLVFDLSGLTVCDSSGLTAFVAARNQALAADAGLVLGAVPERVLRILRISGLDRAFSMAPGPAPQ
jgi:anti-sigma B factor antagonist